MPRRQDAYSSIADEIAEWLEATSDEIADALVGGGPAPFSANLTQAELVEFYDHAFFNPDGSPNLMGRDQQMQRLGAVGYANALRVVTDARLRGQGVEPEPMVNYG